MSEQLAALFGTPILEELDGFELENDDKRKMHEVWPEGEEVAVKVSRGRLPLRSRLLLLFLDIGGIFEHESSAVTARRHVSPCRRR